MKKKMFLMMLAFVALAFSVNAQGGGPRMSMADRIQRVHKAMDSAFKLEPATLTKVDTVFATYYRAQEKVREEMMSGGERPDMQAIREKMAPLTEARDKELKTLLSADQFTKWKEEIEPAMMPRRGGGGGRN